MMCAAARLKDDHTRLLLRHERRKLLVRKLLAELDLPCPMRAMDLENCLCQINPNHHILQFAVLLFCAAFNTVTLAHFDAVWGGGNQSILPVTCAASANWVASTRAPPENGRSQTQEDLRIAKNGPEPKVCEAKRAAHHQTQGNNRSDEGRCRVSGGTCYEVAAKNSRKSR
jgi:hypothetical protein